jgi:hypothetical protein
VRENGLPLCRVRRAGQPLRQRCGRRLQLLFGRRRKRRSRRAPCTAGLPGGVPPPPRPEGLTGLLLLSTDAAAAGGDSKRRGRHTPRARTGRRAYFNSPPPGGTRPKQEQGGAARCVGPLGEWRPPGSEGPPFPPQAGARAARRPSSPEPFVACPCAAQPQAPRLRRFQPTTQRAAVTCAPPIAACNGRRGAARLRGCLSVNRYAPGGEKRLQGQTPSRSSPLVQGHPQTYCARFEYDSRQACRRTGTSD